MGYILISMVQNMRGYGRMISKRVLELKLGLMGRGMKAILKMGKRMGKECIFGAMVPNMLENGKTTRLLAK